MSRLARSAIPRIVHPLKRLWPDTLVGRTVLVVLAGVVLSNLVGVAVYTGERLDLLATTRGRLLAQGLAEVSDLVVKTSPEERPHLVRSLRIPGMRLRWSEQALVATDGADWRTRAIRGALEAEMDVSDGRLRLDFRTLRPGERLFRSDAGGGEPLSRGPGPRLGMRPGSGPGVGFGAGRHALPENVEIEVLVGSLALADGTWLNFATPFADLKPFWSSRSFPIIVITTLITLAVAVWAVWRASRPLTVLARAAHRLGLDIGAPPLAVAGPREVRTASRAFNEMQRRLQRFIRDRTQMLAAVSHDLRTPITRMRLRAEFVEDEEQRVKMLDDLDEMETMIAATLSFAGHDPAGETAVKLNVAALLQTIAADAADAGHDVTYEGGGRLELAGRPAALKRAFANLVDNAVTYGGSARVSAVEAAGAVVVTVEDQGPGIPEAERERVFEPFYRLEGSRSRATGGVGLGLAIVRAAVRAHGGEIALLEGPRGGLRAVVTLPRTLATA